MERSSPTYTKFDRIRRTMCSNLLVENCQLPATKDAQLIRENRALQGVAFVTLCLLGPLFTAGYAVGRVTAPPGSLEIPAREPWIKPPVMNPPAPELATPPAGGTGKAEEPSLAARDDQSAAGQVYLQLFAVAKPQDIIDRLRRNGFEAFAKEIPQRPGLHRVFIGPLPAGEVSKTRAELQSEGFPGESVIWFSLKSME